VQTAGAARTEAAPFPPRAQIEVALEAVSRYCAADDTYTNNDGSGVLADTAWCSAGLPDCATVEHTVVDASSLLRGTRRRPVRGGRALFSDLRVDGASSPPLSPPPYFLLRPSAPSFVRISSRPGRAAAPPKRFGDGCQRKRTCVLSPRIPLPRRRHRAAGAFGSEAFYLVASLVGSWVRVSREGGGGGAAAPALGAGFGRNPALGAAAAGADPGTHCRRPSRWSSGWSRSTLRAWRSQVPSPPPPSQRPARRPAVSATAVRECACGFSAAAAGGRGGAGVPRREHIRFCAQASWAPLCTSRTRCSPSSRRSTTTSRCAPFSRLGVNTGQI
jgi:hypothetical protein